MTNSKKAKKGTTTGGEAGAPTAGGPAKETGKGPAPKAWEKSPEEQFREYGYVEKRE